MHHQNEIDRLTEVNGNAEAGRNGDSLFRLPVNSVQDYAILTLDTAGHVTTWSRGAGQLKGFSADEIIGSHFAVFYTPQDIAAGKPQHVLQIALREGRYEEDGWRVRKDGSCFRANVVITPMWDDEGHLHGYTNVIHDITELLAAQAELEMRVRERTAALQASEERFRATFELSAVGMARVSLEGAYLDVNTRLCEFVGYSREELLTMSFKDITPPDDLKTDLAYVARIIAGEIATFSKEKRYIRKDGSSVWGNVSVALVRDSDRRPQYLIAIVENISVRRAAQEALEESEARYRFLADSMPQIVWSAKPNGDIDYTNQPWSDYSGLKSEQAGDWLQILHPDDLQLCLDRWTHALATGETYEVEYRFKRASDGAYRWHLARAMPRRNAAGEIVQWVGTATDIDDFKQAQAALLRSNEELETHVQERTRELVRSNDDLKQFAYVASHDLQEPLRMVTSFMQLLEQRYKGQLDEQTDRWIEFAVDGATRMQTLINDLLTYSRVGTQGKEFRVCNLEEIVALALQNLQQAVTESEAQIVCGPLPSVQGDRGQLVSLLQNLIGNALKYRSEQPPYIHISARREGPQWQFSLRDNGIGIAPQFLERIFVIFQRLHNRKTYPGTGIGLALCKRIVEQHGGHIWAESEVGKGTTFTFVLPAVSAEHGEDGVNGESEANNEKEQGTT